MTNSPPPSSKLLHRGEYHDYTLEEDGVYVADINQGYGPIPASELLIAMHRYQQLQHGQRIEERQKVNGQPFADR